jgi:acetyl-CoA acyltransferase 1
MSLKPLTQKLPTDIVLLSSLRTPITRAFKGGFRHAYPEDLLGPIMRAAVTRANISPTDVQDVLIGNVLAELGFAKAGRMTLNHVGFPVTTAFHTVNRQCSSSLQAVNHVANMIAVGQIEVGLAGGVESMSRNYKATRGIPQDLSEGLRGSEVQSARDCVMSMGETSENVAKEFGISRAVQDAFALESQRRAAEARREGWFDGEIVGVESVDDEGKRVLVDRDDGIREGLTLEKLSSMKPAFAEDGASTAGNSYVIPFPFTSHPFSNLIVICAQIPTLRRRLSNNPLPPFLRHLPRSYAHRTLHRNARLRLRTSTDGHLTYSCYPLAPRPHWPPDLGH